jgi:hypothetical protein
MKIWPPVMVILVSFTSANAQNEGKKLNELLDGGWEPFSAQAIEKFTFVTDAQANTIIVPAYSFFLRRKGGVAYCVRSVGNANLGFCDIIREGQDR